MASFISWMALVAVGWSLYDIRVDKRASSASPAVYSHRSNKKIYLKIRNLFADNVVLEHALM